MIAVDTSALARMFLREPGYERYQEAIFRTRLAHVPIPCIVEFAALRRLGEARLGWIDLLLGGENVVVVGIEPGHRGAAVEAVLRYGKGSGHPAQLNFGDCLTYAAAKARDLPLLFAGDDFRHTDIRSALDQD